MYQFCKHAFFFNNLNNHKLNQIGVKIKEICIIFIMISSYLPDV